MSFNLISYEDLDVSKYNYSKPTNTDLGYYRTNIVYNDNDENKELFIKVPLLTTMSSLYEENNEVLLDVGLDRSHGSLYKFLSDLEENSYKIIRKNSKDWFGKNFPLKVVKDMHISIFKQLEDSDVPVISLRANSDIKIFDHDKKELSNSSVSPEQKIEAVIKVCGFRFEESKYFCDCELLQLLISETEEEKKTVPKLEKDFKKYENNDNWTQGLSEDSYGSNDYSDNVSVSVDSEMSDDDNYTVLEKIRDKRRRLEKMMGQANKAERNASRKRIKVIKTLERLKKQELKHLYRSYKKTSSNRFSH